MKAKYFLIAILLVSFTAFAQETKVPKIVKGSFSKLYPKVKDVKWDKEGKTEFEAGFKEKGTDISVVINNEGKLLETETKIDIKDLPKVVEPLVTKKYKGYKITEAAKIIDDKGILTFEAEITKGNEKKDLSFDKDGKILVKNLEKSETEEKEENDKD